jgi:drug/metabolite transporter (DMT)-like permease
MISFAAMHTETEGNRKIFLLGMILSMTCWGFSWTAGKYLSFYGSPITVSLLRFVMTFVSLYFILFFLKTRLTIDKRGFRDLLIAAILISVYTYLFFKGVAVGQPGAGGVLVTVLNPIISYGIMLVTTRRKPTRNESIGLILGLLAGVVLLKLVTEAENIFKAGNIYFLLAAFSWAVLSLFTAKASRYGSPFSFSFLMYGISSVLLLLISNFDEVIHTIKNGDVVFWFNLFFSATITTSLATTFYFYATARIGASKASSFIFMVPLSAALGSWIFLDEVIQVHTILGGLLGIGAVYILNKK